MPTTSSIARRVGGATLAAVVAATLTACDSDQIGTAAMIGEDRITVDELQSAAQEIIDVPDSGHQDTSDYTRLQRDVLSRSVLNRLIVHVGEAQNIGVTESAVDDLVAEELDALPAEQDPESLLAQAMYTEETFRDAARSQLIANEIVGPSGDQTALVEAVGEVVAEIGVDINPRYGQWSDNWVVEAVSGSISTPASNLAEEEATSGNDSMPPEQAPPGQAPPEQAPPGQAPPEQAPPGEDAPAP